MQIIEKCKAFIVIRLDYLAKKSKTEVNLTSVLWLYAFVEGSGDDL